ncbi:GLPGLI family protein [Chryseobacterium sp. BIGb0232]|uniref:GLPGLI family protein n=1 Tax=Chryseobacterium sp. BIGb0232 TaxID=2940598 RepID=UPI000F46B47F|nr:GLPGLI family protein [Chryseobacterium sp. BIGb0232]MCS4305561.1 GLPGLI family protein [Chryseobacterium sp. BIGb0232]ROS06587.1 GLPGLI family protein [Chryseobacterium nakagawai]
MEKILFFLCFFCQLLSAQNSRFIYEYKYVPDSTNKSNIIKDLMFLDVINNESLFYSRNKYIEDSISIAESKKGKFYIPNADILYRIEKKAGKVFFKTNDYGIGKIKVEESRKINWQIFPDKEKVGELTAQRAKCNFGGRNWTAWFATDLPIQDGPYKFNGLPGLIVKIEDSTNSHIFELVGIKKVIGSSQYPELDSRSNELYLTQDKFIELFKKYRKDPGSETRQLYLAGKIPDQKDSSGNFHKGAEIVREVDKLAKERIKKDNNIIEIDLLKDN